MSYNGSGTFNINSTGQPVVAGTVITASAFNALTTDLATGLTTAITKDGQTTTTARITFAQGITSSLVTDSSSVSTGSIITAGGAGIAKNLYVGVNANVAGTLGVTGVATFSAAPIYSSLTASSAVATDASKGLVSVTNTGTGNNVLATSPTLVTPTLGAASATSITVASGAVGTPSITTTGDTNTGIFFPAADTIAFSEGGTESMRINSSGNVGIGTTSPSYRTQITSAATDGSVTALGIENPQAAASSNLNATVDLRFDLNGTGAALIRAGKDGDFTTDANCDGNLQFYTNLNNQFAITAPVERMRIDSSGNVLVQGGYLRLKSAIGDSNGLSISEDGSGNAIINNGYSNVPITFQIASSEKVRIDGSGRLLVGKTASNIANAGVEFEGNGYTAISRTNETPMSINRLGNDGVLLQFLQATTEEGTISVSGTTVSYNGGHLSRWAQMLTKPDLLKGTVMSNLDAMNVYTDADGNPVENEQLNKVKVSDVEGDANVAGVFVNWTYDEAHQVDEINMAMTGDMIIRIAQGVTVQRGDLLMSAGDGTAKTQGDDIVRSKTIAKVTSNHVTCTYADGSYCVPCVLMAC